MLLKGLQYNILSQLVSSSFPDLLGCLLQDEVLRASSELLLEISLSVHKQKLFVECQLDLERGRDFIFRVKDNEQEVIQQSTKLQL